MGMVNKRKKYTKILAFLLVGAALSGCGAMDRVSNIGKAPEMAAIENPHLQPDYKPVSMPMPAPVLERKQPNSLWASNRQAFFKDQRASNIGDILTVMINIDDEAELENETERTRNSNEDANLGSILGYEGSLNRVLPEAVNPANLAGFDAASSHNGEGSIEREEEIDVKLAAIITQILPNGNFVIQGRQEVRVNYEKRILQIAGIIRPEDVSTQNTINYDQIAEARIVYGGEGHISDVQQPRYGQQFYDIVFPF
jgi:flagellar L-ring protein precursor FlgH